jgi:hypothetical protein
MEKFFLKIARGALVTVIALSLLFTIIAAVYGAIQFFPSSQPKAPEINIKLKDMTVSKASAASEVAPAASGESDSEKKDIASKECESTASKISQLATQIGWDKKSNQVFNPGTMQYETTNSVDYSGSVNTNRFCQVTQNLIEEQNIKLSPYIKKIDLTSAYYKNLDKLLDEMQMDAVSNKALSMDDPGRYFMVTALQRFDEQFSKAVDDARDSAAQKEAENAVKKARGTMALYMAGIAFAFFFTCCLTLVFIRIEVNTRELVEVIRAYENKPRGESVGSDRTVS